MANIDPNKQRKAAILKRARSSQNSKARTYATKDLMEKIDESGPHAGAWLEALESNFDILKKRPEGLLRTFREKDFDDLFEMIFGYPDTE